MQGQMHTQSLGILISCTAVIQVAAANDGPLLGHFGQFKIGET